MLFGPWEQIVEGDTVRRTGHLLEIPVGEFAGDYGYDLDEEGQPLSDDDATREGSGRAPSDGQG